MKINLLLSDITLSAGTERAVINLANNLYSHGHEVSVISLYTKTGEPFFVLDPNIQIKHLNVYTSKYLFFRVFLGFFSTLISLYKETPNRKLIILGTTHAQNFVLAILKLSRKANKYIGCEHLSVEAFPFYFKFLRRLLYPILDFIVVLTESDRKYFNSNIPKIKCAVIPNQVSFYPEQGVSCEQKKILAIGRYTYQKGFDILIKLLVKPLQMFPDWGVEIVGDGEEREHLEGLISSFGLNDRILLLRPTKQVLDLYLNSSIYAMTSRYEGLPLVLLEAKACGLPIIAYDCPTGPKEIIKENDGILVDMLDSVIFESNLILLMGSFELRKKLGASARINSSLYSIDTIYSKWISLFEKL